LGLPEKSLGTHNPYIKSKVYPANCPHPLLVPKTHGSLLAANLDRFIDSAAVTQWEEDASRDRFVRANGKWKFYKARKGEILEDIADKNGIALASLKKWNHLQGNKTKKAVRLKIFIPSSDPHKIENNQEETQAIAKPETEKKKDFFNEKPVDLEAETHVVKKGEKLYQVAIQYGLTMAQLRKLNHLPSSKINEGQVLNLRKEVENQPEVKVQEVAIAEPIAQDSKTVIYEVQKGDRLFALSKKFNISVSKLRALNQLETDVLKTGQVLKVSEPELNLCKEENVDSAALVQVSEPESKTIKKSEGKSKPKAKEVKLEMAKVYLVQKGDTLYSISKKFASLSIKDIIRLNKLKNKNIKPGQQLIIG
jgi:membrane-bound lytic murein transglycosylase D